MCLIIHQPKGHTLSRSHLLDIGRRNGDGFGVMRADRGTLHTFRDVLSDEDMIAAYAEYAAGRECIIHWRQATHGQVNQSNAHPFPLGNSPIAMVHNGMLDVGCPIADMSDTWHYTKYVLEPIAKSNPNLLFDPHWQAVNAGAIGRGNKVAILHADGRLAILNRSAGVEHAGRWYSNTYAWSAPESLRPVTAKQYATTAYRWAGLDATTKHIWDEDEADYTTEPDAPDTATDDDDYEVFSLAVDELAEAVERDGDAGALRWAHENWRTAMHVMCSYYEMTADDCNEMLKDHPAAIAEWLSEIATATF
jgi:hypothetical protein